MYGHSIFVLFNSGLAFTSSKLHIIHTCVKCVIFRTVPINRGLRVFSSEKNYFIKPSHISIYL